MKINEIIVRLEKWAETLGYSTKQGDLSEIIKDLREEAKVFSPNAVLAERVCDHDWVSSVAYKGAKYCGKCGHYK